MAIYDNVIMLWSGTKVSDHNRAALSVTVERIENLVRMANGRLRRTIVAKKRTWTTSWDNIPSNNNVDGSGTVDGGMSGEEMRTFHDATDGAFDMTLRSGNGDTEVVTVMITDFSWDVNKRGPRVDLWTVNVTLEEV